MAARNRVLIGRPHRRYSWRTQKIQGEGDYEATRRYRKRTDDISKNNDVEKAALRAAPTIGSEADDMKAAEAAGKRRAKGEDPALQRRQARRRDVGGRQSCGRAKTSRPEWLGAMPGAAQAKKRCSAS